MKNLYVEVVPYQRDTKNGAFFLNLFLAVARDQVAAVACDQVIGWC